MVKSHVGSQVNVSVDAAPSQDLNAAMTEIRKHYEFVAVKNRKELEAWYQGKVSRMTKILTICCHLPKRVTL
jgi:acidic type I keratin